MPDSIKEDRYKTGLLKRHADTVYRYGIQIRHKSIVYKYSILENVYR